MSDVERVEDAVRSRDEFEVAVGVLTELRGCSPDEALQDFIDGVHETGTSAIDLGRTLVDLASGGQPPRSAEVLQRWGHLLALRGRTAAHDRHRVNTNMRVRYGPQNESMMC